MDLATDIYQRDRQITTIKSIITVYFGVHAIDYNGLIRKKADEGASSWKDLIPGLELWSIPACQTALIAKPNTKKYKINPTIMNQQHQHGYGPPPPGGIYEPLDPQQPSAPQQQRPSHIHRRASSAPDACQFRPQPSQDKPYDFSGHHPAIQASSSYMSTSSGMSWMGHNHALHPETGQGGQQQQHQPPPNYGRPASQPPHVAPRSQQNHQWEQQQHGTLFASQVRNSQQQHQPPQNQGMGQYQQPAQGGQPPAAAPHSHQGFIYQPPQNQGMGQQQEPPFQSQGGQPPAAAPPSHQDFTHQPPQNQGAGQQQQPLQGRDNLQDLSSSLERFNFGNNRADASNSRPTSEGLKKKRRTTDSSSSYNGPIKNLAVMQIDMENNFVENFFDDVEDDGIRAIDLMTCESFEKYLNTIIRPKEGNFGVRTLANQFKNKFSPYADKCTLLVDQGNYSEGVSRERVKAHEIEGREVKLQMDDVEQRQTALAKISRTVKIVKCRALVIDLMLNSQGQHCRENRDFARAAELIRGTLKSDELPQEIDTYFSERGFPSGPIGSVTLVADVSCAVSVLSEPGTVEGDGETVSDATARADGAAAKTEAEMLKKHRGLQVLQPIEENTASSDALSTDVQSSFTLHESPLGMRDLDSDGKKDEEQVGNGGDKRGFAGPKDEEGTL